MFERFDEQARHAVVLAQEEARALNHDYVGAQHLLLGVLRADPDLAAVEPEQIRLLLEPGDGHHSGQMPFSAVARRALEQALREAIALEHRQISAAHLLLALAAERGVRELLDRAGAEALADRERTTARAHAAQRAAAGDEGGIAASDPAPEPMTIGEPSTDARLIVAMLEADGPVAALLRERGVDYAALQPFLDV